LINTLISNVGEDFIAQIKPKAAKLFFVSSEDEETVFYREKIGERLTEKFKTELEAKPQGTNFRQNGNWLISPPNFSKKVGRRVFWISRIEIELEVGTVTNENDPQRTVPLSSLLLASPAKPQVESPYSYNALAQFSSPVAVPFNMYLPGLYESMPTYASQKKVISHKGRDIYEVLWSTNVAVSKELKKPVIEDITHVELSCQPIS
jgi:hypothetical protein